MMKMFKMFKKGKRAKENDTEKENKILISVLRATVNALEDENKMLKSKIEKGNEANRLYQHNIEVLLENSRELRSKIANLETNVDFLVGNLTKKDQKIIEKGVEKVIKPKKEVSKVKKPRKTTLEVK